MQQAFGYLRLGLRMLAFGAWTLFALGLFELHALFADRSRRYIVLQPYLRAWARGCVLIFQVRMETNSVPLPDSGTWLVVCNHRSPLDVVVLLHLFGGIVLSHAGVAQWPIIGLGARRVGVIFVNRSDRQSGARAVQLIRDCLRAGYMVSMFPEGTTFDGDEVRPFRKGFLRASEGLDVEILPMGICYRAGDAFVQKNFLHHLLAVAVKPCIPISVACGKPISRRHLNSEDTTAVQASVQELVYQARAAFDARWKDDDPEIRMD